MKALGCKHKVEYETEGGLVVDIALPQHKIAIEIDGPSHYTCNTQQPTGRCAAPSVPREVPPACLPKVPASRVVLNRAGVCAVRCCGIEYWVRWGGLWRRFRTGSWTNGRGVCVCGIGGGATPPTSRGIRHASCD